jgi:hypothetical protein
MSNFLEGEDMVRAFVSEYGFDVSGHANYDEYGYDIVCSAISAITQSVAMALRKHTKAKVKSTRGWVSVEVEEPNEISNILLDVLRMGLVEIANEYPQHLEVRTKRGAF